MTLATARQRVSDFVDARIEDLVAWQRDFHTANGRYCQFLPTHSQTPDGDVDEDPDRLDDRPHDAQGDPTWRQMRRLLRWTGPNAEKCPASIRVSVHGPTDPNDPDSDSWSLVAILKRPANLHWRVWGRAGAPNKAWDLYGEGPA